MIYIKGMELCLTRDTGKFNECTVQLAPLDWSEESIFKMLAHIEFRLPTITNIMAQQYVTKTRKNELYWSWHEWWNK